MNDAPPARRRCVRKVASIRHRILPRRCRPPFRERAIIDARIPSQLKLGLNGTGAHNAVSFCCSLSLPKRNRLVRRTRAAGALKRATHLMRSFCSAAMSSHCWICGTKCCDAARPRWPWPVVPNAAHRNADAEVDKLVVASCYNLLDGLDDSVAAGGVISSSSCGTFGHWALVCTVSTRECRLQFKNHVRIFSTFGPLLATEDQTPRGLRCFAQSEVRRF